MDRLTRCVEPATALTVEVLVDIKGPRENSAYLEGEPPLESEKLLIDFRSDVSPSPLFPDSKDFVPDLLFPDSIDLLLALLFPDSINCCVMSSIPPNPSSSLQQVSIPAVSQPAPAML